MSACGKGEAGAAGKRRQAFLEQIGLAAVRAADRGGLANVSVRKLGQELDVSAMGLYRYVGGKADIVELMVDLAYGEIGTGFAASGWRRGMAGYAKGLRRTMQAHPWLADFPARESSR